MKLVEQEMGRAKQEKENFVDQMTSEAETAAAKGEMGKVYKITKSLCKKNNCSVSNVKK